jgi:ribonuclease HI
MVADAQREHTVLFTDGAASGNPGPGGWAAVVVTPDDRVTELGGGEPHTTNNRMELTAAIEGLRHLAAHASPVAIYTDSSYVLKGITQWVWSWQRRGWKTADGGDVLNRDLWEALLAVVQARGRTRIEWHWVRGHDGTAGNERVDEIAVAFSRKRPETLYDGTLADYPRAILELPDPPQLNHSSRDVADRGNGSVTRPRSAVTKKGAPYSYLSVIDGVLERHATWAECERRVKGRAGAKFKKALSAAEEASILRGWGFAVP